MKEDGYVIAVDNYTGKVVDEYSTRKCVHCGGHFKVVPGSGTTRGFCFSKSCNGVLCGNPKCFTCNGPFQKWLDSVEWPAPRIFTG